MKITQWQLKQMKLPELRKYAQSLGIKTTGRPKWALIKMVMIKQENPNDDVNNAMF